MPIITSPVSAREDFYDRNPLAIVEAINGGMDENTALTQNWSYTVPSAKKALVMSLTLGVLCRAASTTTQETDTAFVIGRYTPSGSSQSTVWDATMHSDSMAPNEEVSKIIPESMILLPGDNIDAARQFSGTAAGTGNVLYSSAMTAIEFDE